MTAAVEVPVVELTRSDLARWAKVRGEVRLAGGRLARLVYWPLPGHDRPCRPRVEFASGFRLTVRAEDVVAVRVGGAEVTS